MSGAEVVACLVSVDKVDLSLVVRYNPPAASNYRWPLACWANLFSAITSIASTVSAVYFIGDFNLTVDCDTVTSTADYETSVLQMLDEHKLFQVVDVLTTVKKTFDLCFTNELASVINHQINHGLSENYALAGKPCSDHRAVTVYLEIQNTTAVFVVYQQ